MRTRLLVLWFVVLPLIAMSQVPVVLVAGQSNTDGRVDNVELPAYIKRDGYRYCQWSFGSGVHSGEGRFEPFTPRNYSQKPERWAYDAVVYYELERLWQRPFYVIKESLGGTAIDPRCESNSNMHWSADPDYLASTAASDKGGLSLLKAFIGNIGACIDNQLSKLPEGYDIKFMLWHQGESDRSQADSYHDNLKAVVDYVRTYLVNKTGQQKYARLPFICGTFSKASKQGSPKVAAALYQLQQEDPNFHVVDVSDATLGRDQIHFDAAGAELLGKRMFEKITQNVSVVTLDKHTAAEVVWFDGQHPVTYSLPKRVEPVVKVALDLFKRDLQQVTGLVPVASDKPVVKVLKGKVAPDGFRIYVKDGQIVVEGGNGRGMAYGLLELSRLAGVSPWVWWGDIVPERKGRLAISSDFRTTQQPSVAYRGIFINDEDWSTRPWSCKTFEPGPEGQIGPKTYRKIFELLLRLRANTIWPAMHEGTTAFFRLPGAKAMADSCGIVVGTSHCEPLLRNNVGEWDVAQRGRFNYKTNREGVQQYWIERLKEVSRSKDNMFTIGMRGIHDSSMEGYETEQEKFDGLQQVIDDQQQLLRRYIGKPEQQMQVFVPYKEVLQLYEKGLKVPDYVTLMWCDDNYGYMTRYSDASEQRRQGGAGVYYHLSYWGRPHDYLWLTTTQPGLIYNEMRQAYDHNVRKLWIANVHDVKVAGYDLELFLDMAWNIDCVSAETVGDHYRRWLCRQFGEEAGRRLYPAMWEFFRLCGERRPEFTGWTQVELDKKKYPRGLSPVSGIPLTAAEAATRMAAFERVKAGVIESRPHVRPELGDAFFASIVYPVYAAAAMNRKILSDSAESHRAYEEIQSLTEQYNELKGGKWRHLMDAAPRRLPVYEEVHGMLTGKPVNKVWTCDASQYETASDGAVKIQMLGHSMNAVSLPKDGCLTYRFTVAETGNYTLCTALIPTQAVDNGDIRFSVSIDGAEPVVYSLKEPFRSEEWKRNVLRGQALRDLPIRLSAGAHTITLRALDEHIVVDQLCIFMNK